MVVGTAVRFDTIFKLAKIGVEQVIPVNEVNKIGEMISNDEHIYGVHVSLSEFGLKPHSKSMILNECLKIIEKDYVSLMSITEIANRIQTTEGNLAREFKRANIVNPKRLLMMFASPACNQVDG